MAHLRLGRAVVADSSSVIRNTYWLLALSMLPTIAGAYRRASSINFAAFYKTSPIMAPLLMFGAMFGMLFVVSALRNSALGRRCGLRLHLRCPA